MCDERPGCRADRGLGVPGEREAAAHLRITDGDDVQPVAVRPGERGGQERQPETASGEARQRARVAGLESYPRPQSGGRVAGVDAGPQAGTGG